VVSVVLPGRGLRWATSRICWRVPRTMGSARGMPGRIAHSRGMIAGPLDTCDFVNKRRQKACNQGSYLPNQDQSGIQNSISQGARAIRPIPHRGLDWQVFYFIFYFWSCRTNSVRSKNRVEVVSYFKVVLLRSCIFQNVKKYKVYPEILPFFSIRRAQLGSLAEIAISLQIKRPIGRFQRSICSNGPFDSNFSGRFDSNFSWNSKKSTKTKKKW